MTSGSPPIVRTPAHGISTARVANQQQVVLRPISRSHRRLFLRRSRCEKAAERGRDRRQRRRDRRQDLVILPAAAERFIKRHQLCGGAFLRQHVFLLDLYSCRCASMTLSEFVNPRSNRSVARVTARRAAASASAKCRSRSCCGGISFDRGVHLAHRIEHRLLVVEQQLAGAKIGLLHHGVEPAEIQQGSGDRRPDRPYAD